MIEPSERTRAIFPEPDLCDAYGLSVAQHLEPEQVARLIFHRTPAWIMFLMAVRNALMKPFGLVTSEKQLSQHKSRFGMFPVVERGHDYMVLGLDDRHLDFRIVLEVQAAPHDPGNTWVTLGTNVKCHNALGRAYLAVIKPFHRRIAKAMLGQLALRQPA